MLALALPLLLAVPAHAGGAAVLVQGFEGPVDIGTWPEGARVEVARRWSADGDRSLLIHAGSMAAVTSLDVTDWSPYQVWRLHVFVPGSSGCVLGLELQDDLTAYHNRHQNNASAPPGESVVEVDIAGDLWRGEVNRPYRDDPSPLHKDRISRLSVTARGASVYVDRIELVAVTPPGTPGGWAFDFGGPAAPAPAGWIRVEPGTGWDARSGFGFTGTPRALAKATPYPTPMMGDGLVFGEAEFSVTLAGGPTRAWAVFERSGFWGGEQAAYRGLAILADGTPVHSHYSSPARPFFGLQDVEVLDARALVDDLVLRRQGAVEFSFEARPGRNRLSIVLEGVDGVAPRLAGLALAPDTEAGNAFIGALKRDQRDAVERTHRILNPAAPGTRRAGLLPSLLDLVPRLTGRLLAVRPLPTGTALRPEAPRPPRPKEGIAPVDAFAGQTRFRLLGLWAREPLEVRASIGPLEGPGGGIPADRIRLLGGRYLPSRDYDTTACRIETHHYRPAGLERVGPGEARALLVRVDVPENAAPGRYAGTLVLSPVARDPEIKARPVRVELAVVVHPGGLPPFDFPVGLYFSAPPVPARLLDDPERWWDLAAEMLDLMAVAGRTAVTGGPHYTVRWEGRRPVYEGADCVRLLAMAAERGLDGPVAGYGGFTLGVGTGGRPAPRGLGEARAAAAMFRAWEAFRTARELPRHYVYAYDEPGTPAEFEGLERRLRLLRDAGFPTTGATSVEDPDRADDRHRMLMALTDAPAFNRHSPATLAHVRALGGEPWVYNNGLGRYEQGVHLWRSRREGAAGRLDWIAAIVQGWQFDALDSREPDASCFYVHNELGVLFAPRFLSMCEGAFDARLLFALEREAGDDPAALALLDELAALPYRVPPPGDELDRIRARALRRLEAARGR